MFWWKPLSLNVFSQQTRTSVRSFFLSFFWGLKKALMGNVWNHKLQLQVDEAGWRKMGTAQTVLQRLIMKHLQGPTDDGFCVLQCESAGVDFSFLRVSVLECFLIQSNVLCFGQYCIPELPLLCWVTLTSHSSWFLGIISETRDGW